MRYIATFVIAFALLACQIASSGQRQPLPVSLSQLIESPQKFDEKRIEVQGFLVIWTQPRHPPFVVLYVDEKDAEDFSTKNGILVIPGQELLHSKERIDREYGTLVGSFRAVRGPHGSYGLQIRDIQKFNLSAGPGANVERER